MSVSLNPKYSTLTVQWLHCRGLSFHAGGVLLIVGPLSCIVLHNWLLNMGLSCYAVKGKKPGA